MKRILHIINGMSSGGAESYIMNIYRNIDRSKIQFDFLLRDGNEQNYYINEIKKMGGRVYFVSSFPRHIIKNYIETKSFFKEHDEYEMVEIHANALIYITPLLVLYNTKVKTIMHSHSTTTASFIFKPIHYFNRLFIRKISTYQFACSDAAGKWMFKKDYDIINNAIDVERFQQADSAIDYSSKYIICNVARFLPVKNHEYLIRLFLKFHNKYPSSELILIGDGPLKEDIVEKVKKLGIEESVSFLGEVSNVEKYLYNGTCFVLPSLYEGIPLTLIEAQALGMHCVVSNKVDEKCNIIDNMDFVELDNEDEWIEKISEGNKMDLNEAYNRLSNAGYDIKHNINKLEKIYMEGYV